MDEDEARNIVVDRAFEAPDLDYLLEKSKGKTPSNEDVFRPWFVAAKLWATSNRKRLTEAESAKWNITSTSELIRGLLELQQLEDRGVTVPEGYEPTVGSVLSSSVPRTTSVPTIVSF